MKSLEIFTGAGGLAKGMEIAGFQHESLIEWNKHACATLRKNFNPEIVFEADIATFSLCMLNDIGVVAGGPPCQPFSLGGKHKSHNDSRDMFRYGRPTKNYKCCNFSASFLLRYYTFRVRFRRGYRRLV